MDGHDEVAEQSPAEILELLVANFLNEKWEKKLLLSYSKNYANDKQKLR
jgi:hypothetical protein